MTTKKNPKQDLKKFDGRQDELDPRYIFSLTYTQLLVEALNGEFDIEYMIRKELANRGLDKEANGLGSTKQRSCTKSKMNNPIHANKIRL